MENHHYLWENYGKSPFLMGKLWKDPPFLLGKLWKDPPFLLGKLTITMAIFDSYVTNYQRVAFENKIDKPSLVTCDHQSSIQSQSKQHGTLLDNKWAIVDPMVPVITGRPRGRPAPRPSRRDPILRRVALAAWVGHTTLSWLGFHQNMGTNFEETHGEC